MGGCCIDDDAVGDVGIADERLPSLQAAATNSIEEYSAACGTPRRLIRIFDMTRSEDYRRGLKL